MKRKVIKSSDKPSNVGGITRVKPSNVGGITRVKHSNVWKIFHRLKEVLDEIRRNFVRNRKCA